MMFDDEMIRQYLPDKNEIDAFYAGRSIHAAEIFSCKFIPEASAYRFCLWAPNAKSVSVVGDFNDWNRTAHPMTRLENGVWELTVSGQGGLPHGSKPHEHTDKGEDQT